MASFFSDSMLVGGTEVLHLGNIKFDAPPNNSEGASCHGAWRGGKTEKHCGSPWIIDSLQNTCS